MMQVFIQFSILTIVVFISGCASLEKAINPAQYEAKRTRIAIENTISAYSDVVHLVKVGDSKQKSLGLLLPTQTELPAHLRKFPESIINDGKLFEVYYIRSGWVRDGLTTDEEFTPYVFIDGTLVAIGWNSMNLLNE